MELHGSCYCGECQWTTRGQPNWVCTCHCESCRRNCGAPFTTFFAVNNAYFKWTRSAPRQFRTVNNITRFFCADCGTPMAYHNPKWDHETHFYVAGLSNPEILPPQFHVHWEERLSWISADDGLPKFAQSADGNDPV